MALIPSAAVPAIRAALVSQGFPGKTIADDGTVDPVQLFSGAYSSITFMSQVTPTITVNVADLSQGKPSFLPSLVKPTVIFSGRAGRAVIAPEGEPGKFTGTIVALGLVLGLVGIGYALGKAGK